MKTSRLVVALASVLLLASCNQHPTGLSTGSSAEPSSASSSKAASTMAFLQDGKYEVIVPTRVLEYVGEQKPRLFVNDTSTEGSLVNDLGGKFALKSQGAFAHDLFLTIAYSKQEGQLAAKCYGPIAKANVAEALTTISEAVGVPNKAFIAYDIERASWPKGRDAEMDKAITEAWALL